MYKGYPPTRAPTQTTPPTRTPYRAPTAISKPSESQEMSKIDAPTSAGPRERPGTQDQGPRTQDKDQDKDQDSKPGPRTYLGRGPGPPNPQPPAKKHPVIFWHFNTLGTQLTTPLNRDRGATPPTPTTPQPLYMSLAKHGRGLVLTIVHCSNRTCII